MRGRSPEAVVERVGRTLVDGAIVMLHDAAEHDDFEPASVRALPRLLALLDERGLTSVGLDALLGEPGSSSVSGRRRGIPMPVERADGGNGSRGRLGLLVGGGVVAFRVAIYVLPGPGRRCSRAEERDRSDPGGLVGGGPREAADPGSEGLARTRRAPRRAHHHRAQSARRTRGAAPGPVDHRRWRPISPRFAPRTDSCRCSRACWRALRRPLPPRGR